MNKRGDITFSFLLKTVPAILVGGGILFGIFCGLTTTGTGFFCDNWKWLIGIGVLLYIIEFLVENNYIK